MSSKNDLPLVEEPRREIESSLFPSSLSGGLEEAQVLVLRYRANGGWQEHEWRDAFILESFLVYRIRESMRDLPRSLIAKVLETLSLYEKHLCGLADVEVLFAGSSHRSEQTLVLLDAVYLARQLRRGMMVGERAAS